MYNQKSASKKILVRSVSIVLLAVVIGFGIKAIFDYLDHHNITIKLNPDIESVVIRSVPKDGCNENTELCSKVMYEGSGVQQVDIRLRSGEYDIYPSGEKVDALPITITVNRENTSFEINPGYSKGYLEKLLETEGSIIHQVIQEKYPESIGSFTINKGRLYKKGDWYLTVLFPKPSVVDNNLAVHYIVLKKEGNSWVTASRPELYFQYSKYPDIPRDIIDDANSSNID